MENQIGKQIDALGLSATDRADLERELWLGLRKSFIGASEAAACCGLSKWGSPLSVYLDKIGQGEPREQSEPMKWGTWLEPLIHRAYEEREGVKLAPNGYCVWRHNRHDWMACTPDLLPLVTVDMPDERMVQLKTSRTSEGYGEEYTDQVPVDYLLQCQHEMAVMGFERNDLAVLIGGSDFRVFTVRRNEQLIELLIEIEGALWERILRREPPEIDWTHPDTPELVKLLHRPVEGFEVDLPEHALDDVTLYVGHGVLLRELEKGRKLAQARIIMAMGEASAARLPDGRKVRRKFVAEKQVAAQVRRSHYRFDIVKGNNEEEETDG